MSSILDIPHRSIRLFSQPIHPGWGEKKLLSLVREALKREPEPGELFLFVNAKRTALKLIWTDSTGYQEMLKVLPRGGFLLPAPEGESSFVTIPRSKLPALFRA